MDTIQLLPDPRGRDALRCLTAAYLLDLPVELAKDTTKTASSAAIGPGERPAINLQTQLSGGLIEESTLTSAYAICRFFDHLNSSSRKAGQNKKNASVSALLASGSPSAWQIEDNIFWVLRDFQSSLDGVDREAVASALKSLETKLASRQSDYLSTETPSLADIFVWSTVRMSAIYGTDVLSQNCPSFQKYSSLIEKAPGVQKALEAVKGAFDLSGRLIPVPADSPKKLFYLTTAINYTNGPPHMGHAYEIIMADVISRYHRIFGDEVLFCTGTDEHGQKIAATAEKEGKSPIELCDFYAAQFQALNRSLWCSNDKYIRTSDKRHYEFCQRLWKRTQDNGDIYLGTYVGWYNVREETFVTEREAEASGYKDPISGVPLEKMEEVSYFFKMSKYQTRLIEHITNNPSCIQPDFRRNEILSRLKEPLENLSVSRTTFSWGVPVPNDPKHVMYVWFDALANYLTGCDFEVGPDSRFWPANIHLIGKDISWFHTVIWPCMLMSAGIPLPKTVFAHGFVHAADGRKMSKSLGNVIAPADILAEIPADSFRYFVVKEAKLGRDMRFDVDSLRDSNNADLADTLGNLVHRGTGICQKFCGGRVPSVGLPNGEPPFDFSSVAYRVNTYFEDYCLQEAQEVVLSACRDTNKYLTDKAPWSMTDDLEKQKVARAILEALYLLAHLLEPFIPHTAGLMFERLGTEKKQIRCLSPWFDNLTPDAVVTVGDVLFEKKASKRAEVVSKDTTSVSKK